MLEGIQHDMGRVASGAGMPALGVLKAFQDGMGATLGGIAHSLKSSSYSIGATRMGDVSAAIACCAYAASW